MKPSEESFTERNRKLENEVAKLGGRKVLYAHTYYTQEEFWKIYDIKLYTELRDKYFATKAFPDLYEKTATQKLKKNPSKFRGLMGLIVSPYRRSKSSS